MAGTNLTDLALTPLAGIQGTLTRLNDLITISGNLNRVSRETWAFGTSDDEVDQAFEDREDPTVGALKTYTLDDSSMINPLGGAIDFDKIKAVLIINTGTEDLVFKGTCPLWRAGGATPANDETIKPGGVLLRTEPGDGWAVGAGETIAIGNAGVLADGGFDIIILGLET